MLPMVGFSQLTKGSKEFSISLGLSVDNASYPFSREDKAFSMELPMRTGWLVKDNLSVGFYLSPSYSQIKMEGNMPFNREQETLLVTGGLYTRKYFSVGRFYPFLESNLLYSRGKFKLEENGGFGGNFKSESDIEIIQVNLMFGTLFKISDNFALEASFNPLVNVNYTSSGEVEGYGASISPSFNSLNIGVRFGL